ncbi:MAG: hypothetical protein COU66_00025 [Candidatus Pacebacteria bacterium CG10_big_fil_rev_8_21_14_0_10_44_11]|nr:MAG: hypothetical protein COU66_00025 [Candidatus Pacebacteria bacterium CG10_big_fil_rev_8_21_14_0_10_44_11]
MYGHLDWGGVTDTLQELRHRGNNVSVLSGRQIKAHVQKLGLNHVDIGLAPHRKRFEGEPLEEQLLAHQKESFCSLENIVSSYIKAFGFLQENGVNILLGEPLSKTTALVAHSMNLPWLKLGPEDFSAPEGELLEKFDKNGQEFMERAQQEKQSLGLLNDADFEEIFVKEQPPSRIVYSTPKFEGDRTNPSFTYVGADPIEPKQEIKKGW